MIMCCNLFERSLISSFTVEVWHTIEPLVERLSGQSASLGVDKYHLVQLCTALTLIGDPSVDQGLMSVHLPRIMTNLVLQYELNNMLHCACSHFFSASLRGALRPLLLSDDVAAHLSAAFHM